MVDNAAEATEIMARRAGVSVAEYQGYAAGTTLFSLEQNLEALGEAPADCAQLGADAARYIECVAPEISSFLKDDAALIDVSLDAAEVRSTYTDEFVKRSARR